MPSFLETRHSSLTPISDWNSEWRTTVSLWVAKDLQPTVPQLQANGWPTFDRRKASTPERVLKKCSTFNRFFNFRRSFLLKKRQLVYSRNRQRDWMPNRITCFVATSSKNMELTKTGTSSTQLQQLEFSISVTRLHGTTSTKAMSLACQRDLSSPRGRYVDRKLFVALELVQNPPPPSG